MSTPFSVDHYSPILQSYPEREGHEVSWVLSIEYVPGPFATSKWRAFVETCLSTMFLES